MEYIEPTISTKRIFEGNVINLRVDTVTLPDNKTATREVVEHPGGVGVLPIDENGNVYLVKQYRKPYDEVMLEIPAGKLDKGEDPFECGKRELEEETGFKAASYQDLGVMYPTVGFADEKLYIYLARDLTKGNLNLDEDEYLDLVVMTFDEAYKMVMNGEIKDAKTIIAILKAKNL